MTLYTLIKKGGLIGTMTATSATPATQGVNKPGTVAPVATVAVIKGTEHASVLSTHEEHNSRDWLAYIGETDLEIIAEVMDKCGDDLGARRYFLKRSEEVPEPVTLNHLNTCDECAHFRRTDQPHLGYCAKGEPEAIAGLWDTDQRYCERFYQGQSKPTATNQGPQGPKQKGEFPK